MYQIGNTNQMKAAQNCSDQKGFQNNNGMFYNPQNQNPVYPVYRSKMNSKTAIFDPNCNKKNNLNASGTESSEYSTPRMVVSNTTQDKEATKGKLNPQVKLTHLFGLNSRTTPQGPQNYSFLSTASSHDSEDNLLRMNTSLNYNNSSKKGFPNMFCFQNSALPTSNNINPYPLQDCRVKSLHISSNNNRKIEEEEKDDEDFILNISKFYINNIEEDPNEVLNAMSKNLVEKEQKHGQEKKSNEKNNMVFEISSRNKLEFNRKKKNFPEGNSTKYDIDLDFIEKDGRTTLMIKNIPNKYDLDSILANIKRNHASKYDFFYLPIDFNNKCNVGYAFINFANAKYIRNFYLEFNERKWEKFNSEKICLIKYARIQGLDNLISHFQFSSVMNKKDKNVRPVILQKNELNSIEKLVQLQKTQNYQKK